MNKHTTGPWGVDATGQVCKRAANGSWDLIAYLDESPYYPDKFANAALIAAAPAMYEALQIMVRAANVDEIDPLVMFASIERAKSALAQAEGTNR